MKLPPNNVRGKFKQAIVVLSKVILHVHLLVRSLRMAFRSRLFCFSHFMEKSCVLFLFLKNDILLFRQFVSHRENERDTFWYILQMQKNDLLFFSFNTSSSIYFLFLFSLSSHCRVCKIIQFMFVTNFTHALLKFIKKCKCILL